MANNFRKLVGFWFWSILAFGCEAHEDGDHPVVRTTLGQIRGTMLSMSRHTEVVFGFFNIPYVAPPVGKLRFQPPQPMTPWEGVRDASVAGMACLQRTKLMEEFLQMNLDQEFSGDKATSEDCLHLDVYTPSLTGARPVMVFIHGGGFTLGWAGAYDMRAFAILEDVVGVVIQYRLGTLGFLSTPDGFVKGNMGFQDQVAALQWVQDNIAKFGGDPGQVTLFGQSAGSMSVTLHQVSPLSRGLFHRAILLSGSAQDPNAFFSPPHDPETALAGLAKEQDCPLEDSNILLNCLQEKPAESFYVKDIPINHALSLPRVDGLNIPDLPSSLFESGKYHPGIDVIAGVNQNEGHFIANVLHPGFLSEQFEFYHFMLYTTDIMSLLYPKDKDKRAELTVAALQVYARAENQEVLRKGFTELVGDYVISSATHKTAKILANRQQERTFFYEFNHRSNISTKPEYVISDHGAELYFVFGSPLLKPANPEESMSQLEDRIVSMQVIKYFANFARTGDPNAENLPNWPQFSENDSYLQLQVYPEVAQEYQPKRTQFWSKTVPEILSKRGPKKDEF